MRRCCCAVAESRATVALSVFTEISKEAVACVFEVTVALATVYGKMCVALSGEYNALKVRLELELVHIFVLLLITRCLVNKQRT
jgi:hypothetical protein